MRHHASVAFDDQRAVAYVQPNLTLGDDLPTVFRQLKGHALEELVHEVVVHEQRLGDTAPHGAVVDKVHPLLGFYLLPVAACEDTDTLVAARTLDVLRTPKVTVGRADDLSNDHLL